MRRALALACLLIPLTGCSGGGPQADPAEGLGLENLSLQATATTGVIRGVVVDEAIRPIAEARVLLTGPVQAETTTTPDGLFGFDSLEPGTYFLRVVKTGFEEVQQSAEVVAGVSTPAPVKVLLPRLAGYLPYLTERVYEGFIECTTSFLVLCGLPNLLTGENHTNDRFTWTWFFEPEADLLQAEMAWESSQSLTPTLYFEMEPDGDCDNGFFNRTEGPSPIYATLNASQIEDGPIGPDCGVYFSLFSGHNEPLPRQPVTGWGIGVTVQQRFTMFVHTFHDFLPPAGWRFTSDGTPTVPNV